MGDILALDVGTTTFKLGVFSPDLEKKCEASRPYEVHAYNNGWADIDPNHWWDALRSCCEEVRDQLASVDTISLSVTTPGLVPIAKDGSALGPAIVFFDTRSMQQAQQIRDRVGEEKFLRETCNLPVPGGSSLCSMLWIKDHQPDVWNATEKFGHTNTYMARRLTGRWAIDPSTVSITGLYNTARHDLTWNQDVLQAAGIPETKLPRLVPSFESVGTILPEVAAELALPDNCQVLCGGNDALLAAYSGGMTEPGVINNVVGTCEITNVCIDQPISSPTLNIRCHVVPDRWVTFFVLNTGGKALEWFHANLCQDMTADVFYNQYMPGVLSDFFNSDEADRIEATLPQYEPYLQGSRYSLERKTASWSGITLETTRDMLLLALVKGNAAYHGSHLNEVAKHVTLENEVTVTGGGAKIPGVLQAKRRWTGDFRYTYQDQSSLLGAAMLGRDFQQQTFATQSSER